MTHDKATSNLSIGMPRDHHTPAGSLVTPGSDANITARIERLGETSKTLVHLMKQEAEAVKDVDMKTFGQLQTIKDQLYDIYRSDISVLLEDKAALKNLPDSTKDHLRKLDGDLAVASAESLVALERAGRGFVRLRERVAQLARETVARRTSQYGADGALNVRSHRVISTGVSEHA